jgi:hypothetical protein
MLTIKEFEDVMNDDSIECIILEIEEESTLAGLNIIAKYLPKSGVEGAMHDQIWGCEVEALVIAGITKADAIKLSSLNWFIEEDSLSSFA